MTPRFLTSIGELLIIAAVFGATAGVTVVTMVWIVPRPWTDGRAWVQDALTRDPTPDAREARDRLTLATKHGRRMFRRIR